MDPSLKRVRDELIFRLRKQPQQIWYTLPDGLEAVFYGTLDVDRIPNDVLRQAQTEQAEPEGIYDYDTGEWSTLRAHEVPSEERAVKFFNYESGEWKTLPLLNIESYIHLERDETPEHLIDRIFPQQKASPEHQALLANLAPGVMLQLLGGHSADFKDDWL